MNARPQLALALASTLTLGCRAEQSDASEPLTDLDFWCGEVETPAFAEFGRARDAALTGSYIGGPCGHVLLTLDDGGGGESSALLHPDGQTQALPETVVLGEPPQPVAFSPTGHLMLWQVPGADHLYNLRTGQRVTFEGSGARIGFSRSAKPELGAQAWRCQLPSPPGVSSPGVGQLQALDVDGVRPLGESVLCDTPSASAGSSRLWFVDEQLGGQVVDVDSGERWPTALGDYGVAEEDALWLSHDGRLGVHRSWSWSDPDNFEQSSLVVDLDTGDAVADCEYAALFQAELGGAPLFLRCDEDLFVRSHGQLEPLDIQAPSGVSVGSQSGALAVERELGETVELSLFGPEEPSVPEVVASFPATPEPQFGYAADLGVGVVSQASSTCADPSCEATLTTLSVWTRGEGVTATLSVLDDWVLYRVLDDGSVLGVGAVVDGPLLEGATLPEASLLGIDRYGQTLLQLDAPDADVVTTFPLGGARALLWSQRLDTQRDDLSVINLAEGSLTPLLTDVVTNYPKLDDRRRTLAVGELRPDGMYLHWGLLPQ